MLYGLFNAIGETLPSMLLARQAAALAKGRSRAAMRAAGEAAAATWRRRCSRSPGSALAEHRAAGRPLVVATTTPYDLVKPLGDWLGFDDVIATRYGVDADGTFDGTIVGPFVWADGKLAAVRAVGGIAHGVDLAESYAYSDSVFDTPLLSAVGHPVAVNPDPSMVVMATVRRWPIVNLDVSPGVVKIPVLGVELQKVALQFARTELMPYARFDISGLEHIPADGRGDHRRATIAATSTPARWLSYVARSGRTVRFLGKKEVFDVPLVGQLSRAMGGIRVDRANRLGRAAARRPMSAIAGGEVVGIMPQGTIPTGSGVLRSGARRGAGVRHDWRSCTEAPVIPVGLWGTEQVWPRSSRAAQRAQRRRPAPVTVRSASRWS